MKGSEQKLIALMQGHQNRFVIPVYQRNYDWRIEQCKQLFDDLVKVIRYKRKSHFFGSIVAVNNPDGAHEEFLVIDGQQRLTTVSLLLLAMTTLLKKKLIKSNKEAFDQYLLEEYLVDKWQQGDTRIKLKPIKSDSVSYNKLFEDEEYFVKDSNLTVNYHYFANRIQKQELSADELFEAICRLEIIYIKLNHEDNPQLIFESLNSTGLALSEGDKIRNFVLMGLPVNLQTEFYEKFWNRIEINTIHDVSSFIRDYLSIKQQSTPAINRVYFAFKTYVENTIELNMELLLSEMLSYSKWYSILLHGNTSLKSLDASINRLNRLETTVTRPFFLEVLRLWKDSKLNPNEVTAIFGTIENYLFRRTMCDLPTNALNKIFLVLHKEILRLDGTDKEYFDKFKYVLQNKKDRARFPDDKEFAFAFENRQVYMMNSKNKNYMFERFENYDTLEDKDVYRHFDDGSYSIEHIMPQSLSKQWIDQLGQDYEEIHNTWLHRIANLTLTAYNSRYSNNLFKDKKNMKNGFLESGIRMNQRIAQNEKWGLDELRERNGYLMKQALDIWYAPVTEFVPQQKVYDSYPLDADVIFMGKKLASFSYKGIEQETKSWTDMYDRVMRYLHSEDETILNRIVYSDSVPMNLKPFVSNKQMDPSSWLEITEGVYVYKRLSTDQKVNVLRRFFDIFNVEQSELLFYLHNEDEVSYSPQKNKASLNHEYWEYILHSLKKIDEEKGLYANVSPTKDNWLTGYLGYSGVVIHCILNYKEIRVEFSIARADQAFNKKLFDEIVKSKENIEQELGVLLTWDRGESKKQSKIYYSKTGLDITDKEQWADLAEFHTTWCDRFYRVFPLYLKDAFERITI